MNKIDIIEQLKETDYKVALFTSFSIDFVFFEKMILRHLLDQNCTYVGVCIDRNCFTEAIAKPNINSLGKSYIVNAVDADLAFHPKLFLLLGEKKAKLIVGSSNLTPAGFLTNKEVCNVFSYDEDNQSELEIIQATFHYFQRLNRNVMNIWNPLFEEASTFSYLKQSTNDLQSKYKILFNDETSFIEQLEEWLPENIEKIECFTPYFDQSLAVIDHFESVYRPKEINIYLQNETTNFPLHQEKSELVHLYEATFLKEPHKRYHGKVFRFIGREEELIMYGSANCSKQALLRSFRNDGNAETVIIEKAVRGAYDFFFDESITLTPLPEQFDTIDDDEYTLDEAASVQFLHGVIKNNELLITLKSKVSIDAVKIQGVLGKRKKTTNDLVTFSFNVKNIELNSIYEVEVVVDDVQTVILGWCNHVEVLQQTFDNLKKSSFSKLEMDRYLEDYQNVVLLLEELHHHLIMTDDDVEQSQYSRASVANAHQKAELNPENDEISGNTEDYYVDEDLYEKKYGSIAGVDVLGSLIKILLRQFLDHEHRESEKVGETQSNNASDSQKELSEDLKKQLVHRMNRFMSKFKKGLSSVSFLEKIECEAFVKNCLIYTGFLWKLEQKLGNQLLTKEQLINECYSILTALEAYSEKHDIENVIKEHDEIVAQMIATIVAKDYLLKEQENYNVVRSEKKRLGIQLKNVHQRIYPIREGYEQISEPILQYLKRFGIDLNVLELTNTLEDRFPILTYRQFMERIYQLPVMTLTKPVSLSMPAMQIKKNFNNTPDFNLFQLNIFNFMLMVEEWEEQSSYSLHWINTNMESNLQQLKLTYDLPSMSLIKTFYYRNGLEPFCEKKTHVYKKDIHAGAEKGLASVITDGFKMV